MSLLNLPLTCMSLSTCAEYFCVCVQTIPVKCAARSSSAEECCRGCRISLLIALKIPYRQLQASHLGPAQMKAMTSLSVWSFGPWLECIQSLYSFHKYSRDILHTHFSLSSKAIQPTQPPCCPPPLPPRRRRARLHKMR